jgi:hypothetical protein
MTTVAVDTPKSRTSNGSWLLVRTVARMYRAIGLVLFLMALGVAALLLHRYQGWAGALALRERVGDQAYYFSLLVHGAHPYTDSLSADGERIAFLPALYAALCTGVTTGQEWQSRRVVLTLSQSVSPRGWFALRWSLLAALFTVLLLPLVVLYRLNVTHATHLGLLSSGSETQTIILTIGPVTLANVILGVAAGALAGTVLRNTWSAAVAGPVLTWVLTALLVRSRSALLLDVPAYSKVSGMHPGGVLGLQFYNLLPTDSYLLDSLSRADYWPYQLAESALVLAVAALLVLAAFRILHRRTGQP